MKTEILQIADKLEHNLITDDESKKELLDLFSVSKRFTIEEVKKMFFDAIQIGNGYIEDTHYPDVDVDIAQREWEDYIKDNNVC